MPPIATCLIVQHVAPEQPVAIRDGLSAAGVEIVTCAVHAGDAVPGGLDGFDGLVVMGGPMSARSDEGFPTRQAEIGLLAQAVNRGMPTLGVCLGAQLLAAASGGVVFAGEGLEVGWAPVHLTAQAEDDPLFAGLPRAVTVLHWHGETYRRPPDGVTLASNARYPEQAFRVGPAAWGLQFHIEVDDEAVRRFVAAFPDEAAAAPGGAADLTGQSAGALHALAGVRATVLGRFARLVAGDSVHRRVTATPLP